MTAHSTARDETRRVLGAITQTLRGSTRSRNTPQLTGSRGTDGYEEVSPAKSGTRRDHRSTFSRAIHGDLNKGPPATWRNSVRRSRATAVKRSGGGRRTPTRMMIAMKLFAKPAAESRNCDARCAADKARGREPESYWWERPTSWAAVPMGDTTSQSGRRESLCARTVLVIGTLATIHDDDSARHGHNRNS